VETELRAFLQKHQTPAVQNQAPFRFQRPQTGIGVFPEGGMVFQYQ
jgi:hypothetical protein